MEHHYLHATLSIAPVSGVIGSLVGYLPPIAAGVSIIWICIQAYFFFKDRRK